MLRSFSGRICCRRELTGNEPVQAPIELTVDDLGDLYDVDGISMP